MNNDNAKILKASGLYIVFSFLQPLANYILFPVFLKNLTEENFGIYSTINSISGLITLIGGLNIIAAVPRYYYEATDEISKGKFLSNILSLAVVFNLAILMLSLLFGDILFSLIFKNNNISFYPFGLYAVIFGLLSSLINIYIVYKKIHQSLRKFIIINTVIFVVTLFFQLLFISYLNFGLKGALAGRFLGVFVGIFFLIKFIKIRFINSQLFKDYKSSIKFGVFNLFAAVISWVNLSVDRFIIEQKLDLKSLGIFSYIITITGLAIPIITAIGSAIQPMLYENLLNKDIKKNSGKLFEYYLIGNLFFISLIILMGCNLDFILSSDKIAVVKPYIPIILMGHFLGCIAYFNLLIWVFQKRHGIIYLFTFLSTGLNLVLNLILIPHLHIWGAAIASFLPQLLLVPISTYFSRKKNVHVVLSTKFLGYLIISLLVIFALYYLVYKHVLGYSIFSIAQFIVILIVSTLTFILPNWKSISSQWSKN